VAIHKFVAPQKAAPAPEPQKHNDRRINRRIELEVEVGLESDHNFYTGLTRDISSGGLFVATGVTYEVGDHVTVKFTLPGLDTPITTEAQVRWVRDPRTIRTDGPEGMGLKFIDLTPEARAAIAEFLDQRDSLFYDDE
jgi:type IV pilus assembly protein PilZ